MEFRVIGKADFLGIEGLGTQGKQGKLGATGEMPSGPRTPGPPRAVVRRVRLRGLVWGMRFVFLGTGTSSGVPAIGCACGVCTSADPRDARLRVGAAILFDDPQGNPRVVLIDAGPDLRQQALRAGLTRCDAILFTHNHVDHTFGLDEVRRFNAVQKGPIEVWAEDHTMDHLRRVYRHIFEKDANVNDSFVATLIPRRIDPGMVNGPGMEVFGLKVTPLRLLHGRLPIVGFRIERGGRGGRGGQGGQGGRAGAAQGRERGGGGNRGTGSESEFLPLAYCTDVSGIPPETYPHLRGLGTLVLDALRHRHHPTHLTLSDSVEIAERVGARRTFFIHMAHDLAHEATNATLPPGLQLAHDGLVLEDGPHPEKPRVDEPEETGA